MGQDSLTIPPNAKIIVGTNTFINVKNILVYENENLIQIVNSTTIDFTMEIPIYNYDGVYLSKAIGNRVYNTKEGDKAGVKIDKHPNIWVGKIGDKIVFEIRQNDASTFKTTAELYTPDAYFIKAENNTIFGKIQHNKPLILGNCTISGNTINGFDYGIKVSKDGNISIGGF